MLDKTRPFQEFLESPKNSLALAAARQFCLPDFQCHLLLLTGASGVGKSHLLTCLSNALEQNGFSTLLINAFSFNLSESPQTIWHQHNAILVDNIDLLPLERQPLLTELIDLARSQKKRLALASIRESSQFSERLANRLAAGLHVTLQAPDLNLRFRFAEKMAANLNLRLTKNHFMVIARSTSSFGAISGLLQKLAFYNKINGCLLAPEELEKLAAPVGEVAPWEKIVNRVAEKLCVKVADLLGKSRRHDLVNARQIAMHLCRQELGLSYPELGRLFGGKDHATVMYSIKKISELCQRDPAMRKLVTELENKSK